MNICNKLKMSILNNSRVARKYSGRPYLQLQIYLGRKNQARLYSERPQKRPRVNIFMKLPGKKIIYLISTFQ